MYESYQYILRIGRTALLICKVNEHAEFSAMNFMSEIVSGSKCGYKDVLFVGYTAILNYLSAYK